MKKKLWILFAILAVAVLGVLVSRKPVTVQADGEHQHCICGTGTLNAGDHTSHTSVTWTAWTETGRLPDYGDMVVGDNYYYLTANVTTGIWTPSKSTADSGAAHADMEGRRLILCLNGKTVTYSGNTRFLTPVCTVDGTTTFAKNIDVTFTDCGTTGTVKVTGTGMDQGGLFWMSGSNTKVTIYNGTMDASAAKSTYSGTTGFVSISANSTLKMYGGEIKGGEHSTANGANVVIGSGSFNLYGGSVTGGKATGKEGGNFLVYGGTLNMYGGTVSGGSASNGGNLFVSSGKANLNGGTMTGGTAGCGGNILQRGGEITIDGATITAGNATDRGGNIFQTKDNATTLNCKSGTVSNGTATNGAGNMLARGTIHLDGTNFTGGSGVKYAGSIQFESSAIVTMTAGTISGGSVTTTSDWQYGGNIVLVGAATMTMTGGTVSGGSAHYGGNFYISNATLNLQNGTVSGGTAWAGGNFFFETSGKMYVSGGYIKDGAATSGNGGNLYTKSTDIVISGGEISGGTAGTSSSGKHGGNIYLYDVGVLKMTGGKIYGGKAYDAGGNISIQGSATFTMTGGEIYGGKAGSNLASASTRANVFVNGSGVTFKMVGGTIRGCLELMMVNAFELGGAPVIHDGDNGITVTNTNPVITVQNTDIGTTVDGVSYPHLTDGADVYIAYYNRSGNDNLTVADPTLFLPSGNASDLAYFSSGNYHLTSESDGIHVREGHYHYIYGDTAPAGQEAAFAGETEHLFVPFNRNAVIAAHDAPTHYYMLLVNNVTYSNANVSLGKNVFLHLCLNGYTISSNWRVFQANNQTTAAPGCITICDCSARVSTGVVRGGSADQGGTIWTSTPTPLTIFGGTITHTGTGTHYDGGTVIRSVTTTMYGGTITGGVLNYGSREATSNYQTGGANVRSDNFTMYGGTVEGGTLNVTKATSSNGQPVYGFGGNVYAGTFTMYGGTIKDGRILLEEGVSTWCSGANVRATAFRMYGGTIENGFSMTNGGNVHTNGTSFMEGGVIRGGIANNGYGGNIAIDGGSFLIKGTAAVQNGHASGLGGNIRVGGKGTLTLGESGVSNTAVIENGTTGVQYELDRSYYPSGTAETIGEGFGGNVALEHSGSNDGTLNLYAGTIQNGTAHGGWGGNVFVGDTCVFTMYGGTITGGTADNNKQNNRGWGGNVYVGANAIFTMKDGTISNGTTAVVDNTGSESDFGGNIFVRYGTETTGFFMEGGTITGGSANIGGNVRVNNDAFMTMTGGTIENSVRSQNVFINITGKLTMTGGTIQNAASDANILVNGISSSKGTFAFSGGKLIQTGTPVNVNVYGTFKMSGTAAVIGSKINYGANAYDCEITGGYVSMLYGQAKANATGGYFAEKPDAGYLAEGYYAFEGTYSNPDATDTTVYKYEVAEGYVIETSSRVATGSMPAAAVSGGGAVRKNASFTLTAPEVLNYRLIGWYENGSSIGTNAAYTGTATAARTIEAVYEYGAATGFAVTVNGLDASLYTVTGTKIGDKYEPGTDVTVEYTGTDTFEGWTNEAGKLVSRDAAYTFAVSGDTMLTASVSNAGAPLVVFYTASYQVLKTRVNADGVANALTDADFATVPTVTGKKNGRWTVNGQTVTTVDEMNTVAGRTDTVNVIAKYDNDDAAVYTLTVTGVEEGTTGAPSTWTAYADGDQLFANVNVTSTVTLSAVNGAKVFLYYADAAGTVLSRSAVTPIRYQADTTIYAVYGDTAVPATAPTVTMITAKMTNGTAYFEALRDIPAGITMKEQGILFSTEAGIVYGKAGVYKYASNGKALQDVTGLTLKNAPSTIYARGYVIYTDGTNEGIIYTEETVAN